MKPVIVAAILLMLVPLPGVWAQTEPEVTVEPSQQAASEWEGYDSRETRQQFEQILERHPREVGVLLKLDPSLFRNEAWMTSYPALREFTARHPEIAQNPSYYLESVWNPGDETPETASARAAQQMMEGLTIFAVMLTIVSALVWLIRTLLEHRRWSRVSRVQTEIHNKLLDRFTSHEDLLRYVQSESGRDFIQSATTPISTGTSSPVSAPVGRILWSLQVGVILFAIGLGLQIVSFRLHEDVSASVSTLGILALCGGLGFAASAVVAWIVSRRLGILSAPEVDERTESLRERTLGE